VRRQRNGFIDEEKLKKDARDKLPFATSELCRLGCTSQSRPYTCRLLVEAAGRSELLGGGVFRLLLFRALAALIMVSTSPASPTSASQGLRATLRHFDFTKLWLGQVISSTGDRFYQFALLHLALGTSAGMIGSFGRDSARVIFCGMVLPVLLSGWIGRQVDRRDRKKILFWAEAGRGVIALLMLAAWASGLPLTFLLVLVACSGLLTGLFIPARQSALPMLVPADHLIRGNALMTFAGIAANLAGATAGLAVALLGESISFITAAVGFGISSVLIARIRTPLLPSHEQHDPAPQPNEPHWQSRPAVRLLVWLTVGFTFVTGLFLPFFAEHVARNLDCSWLLPWLKKPEDAAFAGLIVLLGVVGAGLFAGMLTAGQLPRFSHWRMLPVLMLAVWGLSIWRLGATSEYGPTVLLCLAAGWATGLITIPSDARLQHEVSGHRHGRIFARRLALSNVAFLAGLALNLDGRLLRTFGAPHLLQCLGLLAIVMAVVFWILCRKSLTGRWGKEALETENSFAPAHR
jgi:predicted MFS family arabinose efflux permease